MRPTTVTKRSAKLSPSIIDRARPAATPYRVWDTVVPQLHLRVQPSGVKSWNVQWGRGSTKALGKWPGVTVEAARTRATKLLVETSEHGAPRSVIEANRPDHEKPRTFADFLEHDYAPWAQQHQKGWRENLAALKAVFADLGDKLLTDIAPLDVERVKARRLKAGRKPASVNRDLGRLRGALSRAVEWGMLAAHPMKQVKQIKGDDDARVRYLTPDEERRLRNALDEREKTQRRQRASANRWRAARGVEPLRAWGDDEFTDHLAPLVLLAMNTGLRRGELLGLAWPAVNVDTRVLTVTAGTAKARRTRHVPLSAEAFDVLTRWRRQHGDPTKGPVFPARQGGGLGEFKRSWATVVEAAQLSDLRFHDLRHDFASKLVMRGVDLNTVRELLGHADLKMTLRYAHLAPAKLAAAVAVLDAKPAPAPKRARRARRAA